MKKILIFLFMSSLIFSKDLDYKLKELDLKNKSQKLGSFSKLNVSTNVSNVKDKLNGIRDINTVSLNVNYGWFNHSISKDLNSTKTLKNMVGLNKSLNDFLYDEIKEQNNNYLFEKYKIFVEDFEKNFSNYKLVGEYKLKEMEYNLFEEEWRKLKVEENILDKQYELGVISKNDYDYAKRNIKIVELKRNLLNNDMEVLRLKLEENSIDIFNYNFQYFENIEYSEIEKYVKENEIYKRELEIEKAEIMFKKNNVYNKLPHISLGVNYDILNKNYVSSLSLSKEFNLYDENTQNIKNKYEEELENRNKLGKYEERNVLELSSSYENLKWSYLEGLNNLDRIKRDEKIVEKKYEMGSENLVKVIEKRNEVMRTKLNLEKIKLEISLLLYRIKRGVK